MIHFKYIEAEPIWNISNYDIKKTEIAVRMGIVL